MAGWILGGMAVLALASEWIPSRELERRRAADAAVLRHQVSTSQEEARSLRTRLAPRDVEPSRRSRMIEILRASPGAVTIIEPAPVSWTPQIARKCGRSVSWASASG